MISAKSAYRITSYSNPAPLTSEERQLMQSHVGKGVLIVNKVLGDFGLENLPDSQLMQQIVACHHEFLDGSGYPQGLAGDAVPCGGPSYCDCGGHF